jgi:hypothetical protein
MNKDRLVRPNLDETFLPTYEPDPITAILLTLDSTKKQMDLAAYLSQKAQTSWDQHLRGTLMKSSEPQQPPPSRLAKLAGLLQNAL